MKNRRKRFIKIQDGCDKFCHYCVTIYRRGRSRSRSIEQIVGEVRRAEKDGMKEAILTGVDVADFKPDLLELLKQVLEETEEIKVGFGSINFAVFGDELVEFWAENVDRMVNYLHISLQSGCDETLKRMNRRHTVEDYEDLVRSLRGEIEGVKIGTDVMVGYPGETEEEFKISYDNVKKLKLDNLHVFRYSEREGTVAALKGKEWGLVEERDKKKRAKRMRDLTSK